MQSAAHQSSDNEFNLDLIDGHLIETLFNGEDDEFEEVQEEEHAQAEVFSPCSATDMSAFELLFRAQKVKLTAFIRKNMRNTSSVEDVVQQAFMEAYRCWHKFRGESKPETWLYGIALNVVRSNITRAPEYRYQFENTDDLGEQIHTEFADDPMTMVLRAEMMGRLRLAISKLPGSMASVVQLVVMDGYTYEDTALELSIPVGTVRSRLSRARDTLRDVF
ncbi:MAG: RNA polymerase sigma factor [Burkholderiaceae bacterium]